MNDAITQFQLNNGLSVLLKEMHTSPLISHWIWYRVGSRDEKPGVTGISHWTEHMLFKGTPSFPAGELDRAISRLGGLWNAMTYLDWTAYFEVLPADQSDLALQLEADRMRNAIINEKEVETERTVIISERQGNENDPLFLLQEEIQAAAFRVHPYHHVIIGDMADLYSIQCQDLLYHYQTYYTPNNAVLAIAGDFDTNEMAAKVMKYFEEIPPGAAPPRLVRPEPEQPGERRVMVEGPEETTYLQIAYHTPSANDPNFYPLSVLDSLLTGPSSLNLFSGGISNKTSRLYRALVERELAVGVSGGLSATIDPYLYTITVTVPPGKKAEQSLPVIDEEIARLQESPPQMEELTRAVKQARALFAYGSESISNQAFWLGFSEMFAHYEWFESYLNRLAEVTPQDIQRVAQTYLRPQNRVVGEYRSTVNQKG